MIQKKIVETLSTFWHDAAIYRSAPVLTMLFLGFSAGLPLNLVYSSPIYWLSEAGIDRSTVTFFSLALLAYSFKFVWAPLVDAMPLPYLTRRLGRRRSWLVTSQCLIIISIVFLATVDPSKNAFYLMFMACGTVALGFSAATQDIALDAFRIESAPVTHQAALSAAYIAGYRVGMIVSGAGVLFLAQHFGSTTEHYDFDAWRWTYLVMAACMLVGIVTVLCRPEPTEITSSIERETLMQYRRLFFVFVAMVACFIGVLSLDIFSFEQSSPLVTFIFKALSIAMALGAASAVALVSIKARWIKQSLVMEAYVAPIRAFFSRHGFSIACIVLALIGTYRISDIVLGIMANRFYFDMGFTKAQVATVVESYGLAMTLLGGFIGGLLSPRLGVLRMMFWGALLSAGSNLMFMLLAKVGAQVSMLYLLISIDNLAGGLATAAFVVFLSSQTDIAFTATQYAIFSSLMTLLPKLIGSYSGTLVDWMGYENFFGLTALLGVPVLFLVWLNSRVLAFSEKSNERSAVQ